jgi:hypothetical protein
VRGQAKFAEEAWQRNKCVATPAPAPAAASTPPAKKTKRAKSPVLPGTAID